MTPPFPTVCRYALRRQGEAASKRNVWNQGNTAAPQGSVYSAYVAARGKPANRYDAATAFEAAMRGDEVVGIRVGNANGAICSAV